MKYLHTDAAIMGLGGDDSWNPRVREEYLVSPGEHTFAFRLQCVAQTPS